MESYKRIDTEFSQIDVKGNYLVVTMHDGTNLGEQELSRINAIADEYIHGEMGYISNHAHDYSISPVDVVRFVLNNPRLKHIAYVSKQGDHRSRLMALLRLIPSSVKFRTFREMEAAVHWVEGCLKVDELQTEKAS